MKLSKYHFFSKEIQYLGHILSTKGIHSTAFKDTGYSEDAPTDNCQTSLCLPVIHKLLYKIYQ